jgi:transcriptional regulator of aromatic amino acid metabolism
MSSMPDKAVETKDQRIVRLYSEGQSLQKIANKYHVSHIAIRNRLLKAGVTMRPRGRPESKLNAAKRARRKLVAV